MRISNADTAKTKHKHYNQRLVAFAADKDPKGSAGTKRKEKCKPSKFIIAVATLVAIDGLVQRQYEECWPTLDFALVQSQLCGPNEHDTIEYGCLRHAANEKLKRDH